MIFTVPTRHLAGVRLWGDYNDLRSLHETIHALTENSPFEEGIRETILGLAYEIRHAYQGDREKKRIGFDKYDQVDYKGAKMLWPIILFQASALRYSAAFEPTTKDQQADLYRLEYSLEESLKEVDRGVAAECIRFLNSPLFLPKDYYCLFLQIATNRYLEGPGGKRRFKKLPAILKSLYSSSDEYKAFAAHVEALAKEQNCSAHAFDSLAEDCDFKW
jgi:hypothetical protein